MVTTYGLWDTVGEHRIERIHRIAPIQSERLDAPIIGSGQPWLDRLGIPRGALSQAIESAVSAQESDGRDN